MNRVQSKLEDARLVVEQEISVFRKVLLMPNIPVTAAANITLAVRHLEDAKHRFELAQQEIYC